MNISTNTHRTAPRANVARPAAQAQAANSDSVTLGASAALEGFVMGGATGATTLGLVGVCVGEPVGLVAGALYGAESGFTGNKVADVILGGIIGAVAGPLALGLSGAVVGGVGGSVLGGVVGAFS